MKKIQILGLLSLLAIATPSPSISAEGYMPSSEQMENIKEGLISLATGSLTGLASLLNLKAALFISKGSLPLGVVIGCCVQGGIIVAGEGARANLTSEYSNPSLWAHYLSGSIITGLGVCHEAGLCSASWSPLAVIGGFMHSIGDKLAKAKAEKDAAQAKIDKEIRDKLAKEKANKEANDPNFVELKRLIGIANQAVDLTGKGNYDSAETKLTEVINGIKQITKSAADYPSLDKLAEFKDHGRKTLEYARKWDSRGYDTAENAKKAIAEAQKLLEKHYA